jgi:hypothetical protein
MNQGGGGQRVPRLFPEEQPGRQLAQLFIHDPIDLFPGKPVALPGLVKEPGDFANALLGNRFTHMSDLAPSWRIQGTGLRQC